MGKTRLAQQLAHILRPHYADGVTLVNLAPIDDAALVDATALERGDAETGLRLVSALWLF